MVGYYFLQQLSGYVTSYSEGKGHCGHYNLSGNVAEWVKDWYGTYGAATVTDPEGPVNGTERVVRGGSFVDNRSSLRCTARSGLLKFMKSNHTGFRLIRKENYQSQ